MARTYAELRSMSDEDLVAEHDATAGHTVVGLNYYQEELVRRDNQRARKAGEQREKQMLRLTQLVTALTVINVAILLADVL
jgi:hypothetical protein